ncbi:MAG: DUF1987 domain-containing protein [Bacteroidales bacterium]|nr:DUF1987 domain-containing protein [Bacteroidales bacterium]
MEPLILTGSDDTPDITLNKNEGKFEIVGKSLPEDVIGFYTPVFKWLDEYVANPNENTVFKVQIMYFNSASQRALNELFTILARIRVKGKAIMVEWHYMENDDEMKEAGEEYADISELPFTYKTYIA